MSGGVVGESTALPDGLSSFPVAEVALPLEGATVVFVVVVVVVFEGFESPAAKAIAGASNSAVISNGFRIASFDMNLSLLSISVV
jgi:hypothetical protein